METTLHRCLKGIYAGAAARTEVRVGGFRIDAVVEDDRGEEFVEIQHGSLAALRDKVKKLLRKHRVRIVKPIIAVKELIRCEEAGGRVLGRRKSPKRGGVLDLFHELIYFTRVFPHPRLVLEVPLVSVEEWRYPGHGRRRRWGKKDFVVEDQRLVEIHATHRFATGDDLVALLPPELPETFHTGDLAEMLGIPRYHAQRIAYCLRQMKLAADVGCRARARLYELKAA